MNESVIIKRKNVINDFSFLDNAYQFNEGRIVVYDDAIETFVDKLNPNIKNVIDRNYDNFVQKTQEVAVEIKKLQRQIQWEQDVFEQIEDDLDNQPVLQDLHKQIKSYNDIYHYYKQYIEVIKGHIQVEEKKLIYLREQYKQLKCISQQQNTKKMAGLVKYFREKLSLFQFSKSKIQSRSPSKNNSKVNSPLAKTRNEFNKNINLMSLGSGRKKDFLQVYENDYEFQLTDRPSLKQNNLNNISSYMYRTDNQNKPNNKPRMVFSLKSSPNTHAQPNMVEQGSRLSQTKGYYPNIQTFKQDQLPKRNTQQIKMLSQTNPRQNLNSSLYSKSGQQKEFCETQNNKFNFQMNDISQVYSLKGNSIDLRVQSKKRQSDLSSQKDSYLFTPLQSQRNQLQKFKQDKFRSTQASPSNSFQECSLVSQNSIMNSFNDNLSKQSPRLIKDLDQSQINKSKIQEFQYQYLRNSSLNKKIQNDPLLTSKKQNLKILEFDNTLHQFPIIFDQNFEDKERRKLKSNANNRDIIIREYKNKYSLIENSNQEQLFDDEEQKLQKEILYVQKEIQQERQRSQQIKNNLLLKIKNLNKIDSFLNDSFKATQKYVEKKIDSQEFNEQFYTEKFLEVINIISDSTKPRMGLFSQQKSRENKKDMNLILTEEDLEKISEKGELNVNESQQNLSIQHQNSQILFENSTDLSNNQESRKIRSSFLSIKSILELQQDKQKDVNKEEEEEEIKSQIQTQINISPQCSPRSQQSIFNKLHFYDFEQLKSYQLFFLLIKDENLMGKFLLQNFLKRKRALQIFAQSKQF